MAKKVASPARISVEKLDPLRSLWWPEPSSWNQRPTTDLPMAWSIFCTQPMVISICWLSCNPSVPEMSEDEKNRFVVTRHLSNVLAPSDAVEVQFAVDAQTKREAPTRNGPQPERMTGYGGASKPSINSRVLTFGQEKEAQVIHLYVLTCDCNFLQDNVQRQRRVTSRAGGHGGEGGGHPWFCAHNRHGEKKKNLKNLEPFPPKCQGSSYSSARPPQKNIANATKCSKG